MDSILWIVILLESVLHDHEVKGTNHKHCSGAFSCSHSVLDSNMHMKGFASGMNSYINATVGNGRSTQATASYALYNSVIHNYLSTIWEFHGINATYNASIYCHTNVQCTIKCFGFGCQHINALKGDGKYITDCKYNNLPNNVCTRSTARDLMQNFYMYVNRSKWFEFFLFSLPDITSYVLGTANNVDNADNRNNVVTINVGGKKKNKRRIDGYDRHSFQNSILTLKMHIFFAMK